MIPVDEIRAAIDQGIPLRLSEQVQRAKQELDAFVDRAVLVLLAAGVDPSRIEILTSWGDVQDDGACMSVTRSVRVRGRSP